MALARSKKMRKKAALFGLGFFAALILFSFACDFDPMGPSSSSGSGSVSAAVDNLMLLDFSEAVGDGTNFFSANGLPSNPNPCITPSNSLSSVPASSGCPSTYLSGSTYSNSVSQTLKNCSYGGYTYSGQLTFTANNLLVCTSGSSPLQAWASGSFTLSSSSLTITSSGFSVSCPGTSGNLGVTLSSATFLNSLLSGAMNGPACVTTISNVKI